MIISVLNQKGGAGKTTLATSLARALQLAGKSVLLVDADPQGSARDWAAANESPSVPVVGLDRAKLLKNDIRTISSPYDLVVIDGAPQLQEMAAAAISSSDIIL
ncbi:MAG: AAA family ATPase, partial [Chromatiales bacterium]